MKINSLAKIKNLADKKVFLRVDFNVPLTGGRISEDYKIKCVLPTIEYLISQGARVIIASHLGEPDGRKEKDLTLKPVATRLKFLLKKPVNFVTESTGREVKEIVGKMKAGEIVFLENLRFNQGEYDNNLNLAKEYAALADIYVNDALAVSHREQASVSAIKKYLPAYAGLLLEKEIIAFNNILKPLKPLVVIMGGAKIKTKAPLISKLYPLADQILIGGALANNFWKYQGLEIGKSLVDEDCQADIKKFFKAGKLDKKIILPLDVVVKTRQGEAKVAAPGNIKASDCILDIGAVTIEAYSRYIKAAKTLVWNGPLGKFEESSFKHGTLNIACLVAARSSGKAYGLIGGGETVEALKLTNMSEYVDWISTAGGAMLTYLGGGKMPGLKKIII